MRNISNDSFWTNFHWISEVRSKMYISCRAWKILQKKHFFAKLASIHLRTSTPVTVFSLAVLTHSKRIPLFEPFGGPLSAVLAQIAITKTDIWSSNKEELIELIDFAGTLQTEGRTRSCWGHLLEHEPLTSKCVILYDTIQIGNWTSSSGGAEKTWSNKSMIA